MQDCLLGEKSKVNSFYPICSMAGVTVFQVFQTKNRCKISVTDCVSDSITHHGTSTMNLLDLVKEIGLTPKRKAACHAGEFCSPCPFCKEGVDRFLIWPHRHNKNGVYQGGRFSCRVCGKYGDAITFLRLLHDMSYQNACAQLHIEPKLKNSVSPKSSVPKPHVAENPPEVWKRKAACFVEWAHKQLLGSKEGMNLLISRGLKKDSIDYFTLGYSPQTFFRNRNDWGLPYVVRDDGKPLRLWLPAGIVIPTYNADNVIKIKIRRSDWKEGDQKPKYVEISGSKLTPSIYGDISLPFALVLESELDALLIQQEASDLAYCVALGGSTKPLDADTEQVLRKTSQILFLPDLDLAGATAWVK